MESGEFKRVGRGGREVWIRATYNPIFNLDGRPYKIVKYVLDVTETKLRNAEYEGKVTAISRSQATVEFDLEGRILTANQNFLDVVGYSLDEVRGQHHRMFMEPEMARSGEYARFWDRLSKGEYEGGEYKRIAKGGREVWLLASYNPIMDLREPLRACFAWRWPSGGASGARSFLARPHGVCPRLAATACIALEPRLGV